MKYVVASALLALVSGAVRAQTSAGRVLLGGTFSFYSTKASSTPSTATTAPTARHTRWTMAPQAGYFVTDKLAVGAGIIINRQLDVADYASPRNGSTRAYSNKLKTLDLGPFARYYHLMNDKVGFFGQLNTMYYQQNGRGISYQAEPIQRTDYTKGGYASLQPGFVYFPTSKIGLELTLGYLSYSRSRTRVESNEPGFEPYTTRNRQLLASLDLSSLRVGGAFYLGR